MKPNETAIGVTRTAIGESFIWKITKIDDYTRGWFIGNFEPSLLKTKDFEVSYKLHPKDQKWDFHYHKKATEINILVKGKMIINNVIYNSNEVFIINPNIISCPFFLEDCEIICIKIPSIQNDKYIIFTQI